MKTTNTLVSGFATSVLLLTGAAQAGNDPTTGFYEQVRDAQLAHVEEVPARSEGRPDPAQAQAFGNAGGVLNTIWQAHFRGFAHQPATPNDAAPGLPSNFIADIRRIHFGHLDG